MYDRREKFRLRRVRNVSIELCKWGPRGFFCQSGFRQAARNGGRTAVVSRRSEAAVQVGSSGSGPA